MSKDDKDELAKERTKRAEDRTLMANERTFSSWTGTGLGALGMGVAVQAIFKETEPTWIAKSAATIFIIIAIMFFTTAWQNAKSTFQYLSDHKAAAATPFKLGIISTSLSVASIIIAVVLWTL